MASFGYILALIVIALPTLALAADYIVGDDSGWTVGVDYKAWAAGKTFIVGDKLVFKYPVGAHNVYKVTGAEFANCTATSQGGAPLTSGNDVVVLTTAGRKWYMCGVSGHCAAGQKLVITVLPDLFPFAPAPSPWN